MPFHENLLTCHYNSMFDIIMNLNSETNEQIQVERRCQKCDS
jgi:hypothetical protein